MHGLPEDLGAGSTTLPLVTSQRGVGWTHVVKPPLVMRYFRAPSFSSFAP